MHLLALTDHLTSLPNHYNIETFLQSEINEDSISPVGFGTLFCGLDPFKILNDRYRHEAGDLGLKNVADSFSYTSAPLSASVAGAVTS